MLLSKSLSIRNCEKVFRIYVQSKVLYASELDQMINKIQVFIVTSNAE